MLKIEFIFSILLTTALCTVGYSQYRSPMPGTPTRNTPPYILRFGQDQSGALILNLLTSKRYNHGGYKIDLKKATDGKDLSITILGISATDGFHTQVVAPARGSLKLPMETGTYTVTFKEKDTSSTLTLSVSKSSIHLTGDKHDPLFGAVSLRYNILPENVFSIMIVKRSNSSEKDLTTNILADLSSLPGVAEWKPQGGPYLCKSWKYPNRFLTYFQMKDNFDWDALEAFLKNYKDMSHMAITIHDPKEGRQLKND